MYEACYRFAALSKAGIGSYNDYIVTYDRIMAQEAMRKHLPDNPYDCSEENEPRMIESILAAYKGSTSHVLSTRGIQLGLWENVDCRPRLEALIASHRNQPERVGALYKGIHDDVR
jgi:hypothetical protein